MNTRIIEVVAYRNDWPLRFESERKQLLGALGEVAIKIEHIGSTSVKGLSAKPIIDILIEVADLVALDRITEKMEALGYEAKGEFGIPGRRYFPKGGNRRSHQVHAFASGDPHLPRHRLFRDYLAAHPDVAAEYGRLKKKVAAACNNDIEIYMQGKDAFIKHHEQLAREWSRTRR